MSQPIRVLQVFAKMNRGGAETMIMNLYRYIDRTKVQFDFIVHTNEKCDFDDEIEMLGGKIFRVPKYTGINHFEYKRCWSKFFHEHPEYKIIHGHVRSTAAIYLKLANKFRLITIAHSHSISSGVGFAAFIKNIFQYPIRYTADYLTACSELAGKWLFGKKGCQGPNFFILKNAIDCERFAYDVDKRATKRRELQVEGRFVIGHIGRFSYPKNHDFIIDIFKEIHEQLDDAVLLLVGDGELRESIEIKTRSLGLVEDVIFTGVQTDIPDLLHAMDSFIFPSFYEGIPVTLIEAQANGLKCIVSDSIAKDIKVTDLIEFMSLEKEAHDWAEKIINTRMYSRCNRRLEIINAGYDVNEVAIHIQNRYLAMKAKWR